MTTLTNVHNLRTLFLGGAGFIGSAIIREMLDQADGQSKGRDIIVLEPPHADISRLRNCGVTMVRGTVQDTELIDRLVTEHQITRIVHLVSTMTPASSFVDYLQELYTVVRPTIRIMELCARRGVQLIYFSSCAIYGNSTDGNPFRENAPLNPISYYGMSKLIVESNIRFEHRVNGLDYLILRPSNPYGHGQNMKAQQGLIAVAIGKILAGQPITIWGDGYAVRDYICIDDLAKAVCAIMQTVKNEAMNIGSGDGKTVRDIIGYIDDVVLDSIKVQYGASRKSDVSRVVLDTTRMRQFYRQPLTPIRQGIATFYTESSRR